MSVDAKFELSDVDMRSLTRLLRDCQRDPGLLRSNAVRRSFRVAMARSLRQHVLKQARLALPKRSGTLRRSLMPIVAVYRSPSKAWSAGVRVRVKRRDGKGDRQRVRIGQAIGAMYGNSRFPGGDGRSKLMRLLKSSQHAIIRTAVVEFQAELDKRAGQARRRMPFRRS